jgi:hypothetical protein
MARRRTLYDIKEQLRLLYDGLVELDEASYAGYDKPARFIDRDYGSWTTIPRRLMRGTGRHPGRARALIQAARKLTVEEVEEKIRAHHGVRIRLVRESYVDTRTPARFIDIEHGEWTVAPYSVMAGRGHPAGRLKRSIATMRSFESVVHWKTDELCHPASGFEHAVLVWLRKERIDFDWQVPFTTPLLTPGGKKSVYHVDLFIKSGPMASTYVEIKGTWHRRHDHDGGRAKWEWFHAEHPNSQLWMRCDLVRLGIIDPARAYLAAAKGGEKKDAKQR